ncbi:MULTISPECIES: nucleoside-triphosphate diphosphatase [unclassified Streptococcus]|uniref:nucleoside-triphosphate diphosphatase n=1 Tax=unclassified Streptococcus TaxID=2608887 RepID=UPI00359DED61
MTTKIYEYKDDKNWFIGKWGGHSFLSALLPEEQEEIQALAFRLQGLFPPYYDDDKGMQGYQVEVIKKASDVSLIRFVIDIINDAAGRQLTMTQQAGGIVIKEGDRLIDVYVPTGGIKASDFFGQQAGLGDKILIATKNEGKTKEFRKFFKQLGMAVENLNDYPDLPDVEETGTTFEENARLKAETISKLTGQMVLADDSGLKVDILGGLPGVWSARFSGPGATDEKNNAKLLHELAMVFEPKDRSAQFHCTLVLAAPHRESLVVEGEWAGYIDFAPKGDGGFGYDPLFLVGETGKTSAELGTDYKNSHSHRAIALKKLLEVFPEWQALN